MRRYVNECVTGDPDVWTLDGLAPALGHLGRAFSLGCGDGLFDRQLRERGICSSVVGLDISTASLDIARRRANEAGLADMDYMRADMNELALDGGSCDAVVFQQSLHHVSELEKCLDAVRFALRPGGRIYLDEYIGPSRSEWNRALLRDADEIYRALPPSVRRYRRLPLPVDWKDPSEAIRSSEIVREVSRRFAIDLRRDYGGTYLAVLYPHLDFSRSSSSVRREILERLVSAERSAIAAGAPAYYTVIVARKPSG